jgi:hypothetical protein
MSFLRLSTWSFLSVVCIELFFHVWLILTHRIPIGHEGLNYFLSQYFFLNNAVFTGQIPQWIPYMGHGTVASLWYASEASLGQNMMFIIAPLLKQVPFNILFIINIYLDHLILIMGVWLLAGKYYRSVLTRFFVVIAISGSVIWSTQPWFNFHLYFYLPLIFYFFHRFYDTWQWRYFLACGNLLAFQSLGNAAYFFPVISFSVFAYVVFFVIFNKPPQGWKLMGLHKMKGIISIALVILGLLMAAGVLFAGHHDVIHYSYGRTASDNDVPLSNFLNHGGNLSLNKWVEMIVGLSPALDYTLYAGMFVPILFIFGLKDSFKVPYRHLILSTVILLLLSLGSFVSIAFYYTWPLMKLYRHLALISPIIKVFIVFISGLGFERMLNALKSKSNPEISLLRTILLGFLILIIYLLLAGEHFGWHPLNRFMVNPGGLYVQGNVAHLIPGLPILPHSEPLLMSRLIKGLFICVLLYLIFNFRNIDYRFSIVLLVLLHIYDVYEYKYFETSRRTAVIAEKDDAFLNFTPPVYSERRTEGFFRHNPRALFLKRMPACNGTSDCIFNTYAFSDQLGSTFLVNFFHQDFDLYLRAINHQDFASRQDFPKGLIPYRGFKFPMDERAALKMSGFAEDKIQFFKDVSMFDRDRDIFNQITRPGFPGDVPLIYALEEGKFTSVKADQDERLSADYRVLNFGANNLEFRVHLKQSGWAYLAEVFSEHWQGFVNGRRVKIYPANLAYQAIPLSKGENDVVLQFNDPQMYWQYQFWIMVSYLWFIVLIVTMYRLIKNPSIC